MHFLKNFETNILPIFGLIKIIQLSFECLQASCWLLYYFSTHNFGHVAFLTYIFLTHLTGHQKCPHEAQNYYKDIHQDIRDQQPVIQEQFRDVKLSKRNKAERLSHFLENLLVILSFGPKPFDSQNALKVILKPLFPT